MMQKQMCNIYAVVKHYTKNKTIYWNWD